MLAAPLAAPALLACLALLAAAQDQCSDAQAGTFPEPPVLLPNTPLPPGTSEFILNIPADACGGLGSVVGSVVRGCDDVKPTVFPINVLKYLVFRNGDFNSVTGVVSTAVYCQ